MHSSLFYAVLLSGAFLFGAATALSGQTCSGGNPANVYNMNLSGRASVDQEGDPDNNMGTLSTNTGDVVGISFTGVNFTTVGDSWCEEAYLGADGDGPGPDYFFSAEPNPSPCTNLPYTSGIFDLVDLGFNFPTSGTITWELFETFDNFSDSDDANYSSGIVSFYVCPSGESLPINLRSFKGETRATSNMLYWVNASQYQVQWQIIERSADGQKGWQEAGRITNTPDASVDTPYSWEDKQPLPDAYYRLRSIDYDGSEQLSFMIRLSRPGEGFEITSLFPNPVSDQVQVQINQPESAYLLASVVDITGRLVLEQGFETEKGFNTIELSLGALTPGAYILRTEDDRGNLAFRSLVKQ